MATIWKPCCRVIYDTWIPPKTNMCLDVWLPFEGPGAKKAESDMAIQYRFHISPHIVSI